jgi:hypothetical protein
MVVQLGCRGRSRKTSDIASARSSRTQDPPPCKAESNFRTRRKETPYNFLTLLQGLLTVQEVVRQFEFNSLHHSVRQITESSENRAK